MTMGPPQAAEALKECLALGADRCIHLSDRVFALADTLGTSRTLALAIQKEGDVDLVLCGRKTTDSETWQVPPETAAFLGWPHVTSVTGLEPVDGRIRATRETDSGYDTYELACPAVLSLVRATEASDLRDGNIEIWSATDLVGEVHEYDDRFGQTGGAAIDGDLSAMGGNHLSRNCSGGRCLRCSGRLRRGSSRSGGGKRGL